MEESYLRIPFPKDRLRIYQNILSEVTTGRGIMGLCLHFHSVVFTGPDQYGVSSLNDLIKIFPEYEKFYTGNFATNFHSFYNNLKPMKLYSTDEQIDHRIEVLKEMIEDVKKLISCNNSTDGLNPTNY